MFPNFADFTLQLFRLMSKYSKVKRWGTPVAEKTQSDDAITIQAQQLQIPHHYFNGFELGASLSDIGLLLLVDGQPQVKLAMSFTTAKTLALQLSRAIEVFEKNTGNTLMTMDDVGKSYQKAEK